MHANPSHYLPLSQCRERHYQSKVWASLHSSMEAPRPLHPPRGGEYSVHTLRKSRGLVLAPMIQKLLYAASNFSNLSFPNLVLNSLTFISKNKLPSSTSRPQSSVLPKTLILRSPRSKNNSTTQSLPRTIKFHDILFNIRAPVSHPCDKKQRLACISPQISIFKTRIGLALNNTRA